MAEKAYAKYAWILVFIPAFVLFVFPLASGWLSTSPEPDVIKGVTGITLDQIGAQNPGTGRLILELYHEFALTILAFGAVTMAIAAFPFRKGHRFAWYASWLAPALWAGITASLAILNAENPSAGSGLGPAPVFLSIVLIGVLGQLLPYRMFFPKRTMMGATPR